MKIFVLAADVSFTPIKSENVGRIISVFLSKTIIGKHSFRCVECGKILFQYTREIGHIFDGAAIPEEKAEIDVMCHRCKVIYRAL